MTMPFAFNSSSSIRDGAFTAAMAQALDTPGLGPSEARVMAAVMGVNLHALSVGERRTLLAMTRQLAADGDIDPADADTLTTLIGVMEQSGPQAFAPTWPFPGFDLGSFPGNVLFGGLLGTLSGMIASKLEGMLAQSAALSLIGQCDGGFTTNLLTQAVSGTDFSAMSPNDRAMLIGLIGSYAADGKMNVIETRAFLEALNVASGGSATDQIAALDAYANPWSYQMTGNGRATIDLGNGYDLLIDEHSSKFTLINEATGEKTIIWGDPHFDVNGDGRTDMDFWGTMTLNLEDGTKITINTTPYAKNEAMTLSSELTITKGDQAMIVTGLDQNQIGDLAITQTTASGAGADLDLMTIDGLNIYENPNGEGWLVQDGLGFRAVTQTDMNTTKGDMVNGSSGGSFDLLGGLLAMSSQMMIGSMLLSAMSAGQVAE